MILNNESKQNVVVNAESTQKLSISLNENDQAILIDLQINKLYQNKIRAAVQEYMSNARDANVDAGKKDDPILVHIPTADNPVFSVRDVGLGMSPEIIRDYICVVGASTKRTTNNSLGCFGYGSKCGYAYVNEHGQQFSITTVYNGTKYSYLLYYDDKHFPNVSLLNEEKTDEPSGTIVEIPCEGYDACNFRKEIKNILQYWVGVYNFKIVNESEAGTVEAPKRTVLIEHDNYVIHSSGNYRNCNVIVGGIPYDYGISHELLNYHSVDIRMPIGSMNITPSREQLEITKSNTDAIRNVLDAAFEKMKEHYESEVLSFHSELEIFKNYYRRLPEYIFKNCKFKDEYIQFNGIHDSSGGAVLSNWLQGFNIPSFYNLSDDVVFINAENVKTPNPDKINYNYPGKQVIILKQVIRNTYWRSQWLELSKQNFTPFSKNLLEQILKIAVPYSSLKSKPRERSARTEEPTYWKKIGMTFEPQFDDISNLTGVWFLGSSLKPVDESVELVLRRDGLSYENPLGIPGDIYMIPKRNEKKATENPNLVRIMDKAKELLIAPENISMLHSQVGIEIFGNNYLTEASRPNVRDSLKDAVLKEFISKMSIENTWGYRIKYKNSITHAYKKIYGKEFSTPEIEYLRSKYSICSKVRRLEYDEMKEIVEYIWSK